MFGGQSAGSEPASQSRLDWDLAGGTSVAFSARLPNGWRFLRRGGARGNDPLGRIRAYARTRRPLSFERIVGHSGVGPLLLPTYPSFSREWAGSV